MYTDLNLIPRILKIFLHQFFVFLKIHFYKPLKFFQKRQIFVKFNICQFVMIIRPSVRPSFFNNWCIKNYIYLWDRIRILYSTLPQHKCLRLPLSPILFLNFAPSETEIKLTKIIIIQWKRLMISRSSRNFSIQSKTSSFRVNNI